jgi:Asp-tRNA(Asn)/Glu-tRNA(Gln) amidotransferase A subunit family amidase
MRHSDVKQEAGEAVMATVHGDAQGVATSNSGNILRDHDALGLAELVRKKEIQPTELLDLAIAQVDRLNPRLNFIARQHYDYARAAIARGLPEGPFTGVPWLLKDLNTYIAGEVTGQGSRWYQQNVSAFSSEVVRRYERAGLVIFGKTTSPEFGLSPSTESKATGLTRNPWNPEHSSGGSSGGAACAVAAGVIPATHATDGGGSIRIPASVCNLFGLKPSRGRIPVGPPRTERWDGMSVHHVVSHSVRDSAALLDATHGLEPGGRYTAPAPERPFLDEVGRDPGKLRIAFSVTAPAGTPVDPDCVQAVREAAALCASLGHHVEETGPKLDYAALSKAGADIVCAGLAAELQSREAATGQKPSAELLEGVTLAMYDMGNKLTAADYMRASAVNQAAAVTVAGFMTGYDLMLAPVLGAPPPKLGVLNPSSEDMATFGEFMGRYAAFSMLQNQTGQPSISVPFAFSQGGLPIGVMFSSRYGEEALLLRLAGQIEQARPWAHRRPQL